jgi:hypothetical protein
MGGQQSAPMMGTSTMGYGPPMSAPQMITTPVAAASPPPRPAPVPSPEPVRVTAAGYGPVTLAPAPTQQSGPSPALVAVRNRFANVQELSNNFNNATLTAAKQINISDQAAMMKFVTDTNDMYTRQMPSKIGAEYAAMMAETKNGTEHFAGGMDLSSNYLMIMLFILILCIVIGMYFKVPSALFAKKTTGPKLQ